MKIHEIVLYEVIEAPLYQNGYQAVMAGVKQWVQETMKVVDQYTYKTQYRDQVRQYPADDDSNDSFEKRDSLRDDQYDREYTTLVGDENRALHELLVKTFKEMLEKQLREAAIGYMEGQFGKIERTVPKENYEELQKRHLYFMQYIIIDIDIAATYKSGKPRTSGGYMQSSPSKNEFTDTWSKGNVDWGNELGFGIKLYSTDNAIWLAAVGVLVESLHIEHFGEIQERKEGFPNLLKNILPTWVHEVVHVEQWTRRRLLNKNFYKYDMGMSYTPQQKKRPAFTRYNKDLEVNQKFKRGGTRGFPSHLNAIENADTAEWIEYFGTSHEIEAHAAGAAAHFLHDIMQDEGRHRSNFYSDDYRQSQINYAIDNIINDISHGYIETNIHSLGSYYNLIRNEAMRYIRLKSAKRDYDISRDQRVLNKIDIGARKVWTIFLSKLIKHLQSYKKTAADWSERDPRFRLPMPKNQPALPTDDASNYKAAAEFGPMKYK